MEFPFNVAGLLPFNINAVESDFTVKDASALNPLELHVDGSSLPSRPSYRGRGPFPVSPESLDELEKLEHVIDVLGERSAKAQNLPAPITSSEKLARTSHRIYILVNHVENEKTTVVGLLKVGHKQLFLSADEEEAALRCVTPLCLLDFYVCEQQQRRGHGRCLFDTMLQAEGSLSAEQLAIDHPSPKLLSFLERHYALKDALPQTNNFLIYRGFFPTAATTELAKKQKSPVSSRTRSRDKGRPQPSRRRPHSLDSSSVGSCLAWWSTDCDWEQGHLPQAVAREGHRKSCQSPTTRSFHRCSVGSHPSECSSSWNIFGIPPRCDRSASISN